MMMKTKMGGANKMTKWKDLDIKTRLAYSTAIIAFLAGWGLTIAGFIIGAGIISDSVLWVLGQALVYAASIFGVGMYVTGAVKGMKSSIQSFMNAEDRRIKERFVEDQEDEIEDLEGEENE